MFRRRITIVFAGPAWETIFDTEFRPRSFHLQAQKDDCLKAKQLIRQVRSECGLTGRTLAAWLEEAWDDAAKMIESEIGAILAVAGKLYEFKTLDDAAIREHMRAAGCDFPAPCRPQAPGADPATNQAGAQRHPAHSAQGGDLE
jgi:hypothetical protein